VERPERGLLVERAGLRAPVRIKRQHAIEARPCSVELGDAGDIGGGVTLCGRRCQRWQGEHVTCSDNPPYQCRGHPARLPLASRTQDGRAFRAKGKQ
jgi:hypothetical protein